MRLAYIDPYATPRKLWPAFTEFELCSSQRQHIFASFEQPRACHIVGVCLTAVEVLERVSLAIVQDGGMRLQE